MLTANADFSLIGIVICRPGSAGGLAELREAGDGSYLGIAILYGFVSDN